MKRTTIFLSVILIVGHLLTETGTLMYLINDYNPIYVHPFLSPNYQWHDPKGIDLFWFAKYMSEDFLLCIIFFVMARIAYQYSFRLFLIGVIFFFYHVFDLWMLLWNFKTSYWLYMVLYVVIILCIVSLFAPEKKQGIVKSIN